MTGDRPFHRYTPQYRDPGRRGDNFNGEGGIPTALSSEVKKKGYKPGESGDINFLVAYSLRAQQEVEVLMGISKEQGKEWIVAVVTPNDYVSGALLVQIIDAKSMKPLWLGVFNADVTLASVSEREKQERVGYAVHE